MAPFKLRKIDHVVLRVRDLHASMDFYVGTLGCTPEKTQGKIGLYQIRAGDSLIDLIPIDELLGQKGGAPPGREGRNVDHFAIQVTPFDEAQIRDYLAAHSIEIEEFGQRYGAEGEGPSVYIRDPDGNTVELKGPVSN